MIQTWVVADPADQCSDRTELLRSYHGHLDQETCGHGSWVSPGYSLMLTLGDQVEDHGDPSPGEVAQVHSWEAAGY